MIVYESALGYLNKKKNAKENRTSMSPRILCFINKLKRSISHQKVQLSYPDKKTPPAESGIVDMVIHWICQCLWSYNNFFLCFSRSSWALNRLKICWTKLLYCLTISMWLTTLKTNFCRKSGCLLLTVCLIIYCSSLDWHFLWHALWACTLLVMCELGQQFSAHGICTLDGFGGCFL